MLYNLVMAKLTYFEERNKKNNMSVGKYCENLPEFCYDFFIGIENTTSPLTRMNYAMDLTVFFHFLSEIFHKKSTEFTLDDINKIKSSHIEQFLSYLSFYEINGKTYKNQDTGKKRKLSSVRSLFKYLYTHNLISSNEASKIATPKIHQKEIIRLEKNEISKLFDTVEESNTFSHRQKMYNKNTFDRDNAIITLFLGTGIRISELVGLNVEDFDFSQNAFVVTRKGGNRSTLYFSNEVAEALKLWLSRRSTLEIDNNEKAMFISLQNRRISTRAVENLVKKFSKEAAPLKKISPHKLRSTFGTELYRETKDIYIVADVLGHKDVNTTKKHYAAISEDMRRSVANKVSLKDN